MFTIINFAEPTSGGLASLIFWLVGLTSSVAAGVVLFTVILKLITLPFDFMSRFSMRRNSIKMEQMRPELEKLQKQYADNKNLYNQKMMALYKKNGYSMFGACLPTIVSLVIFIVAISAFNDYSKYQNRIYFYEMANSYNEVIYTGFQTDMEYIYYDEDGNITFNDKAIADLVSEEEGSAEKQLTGHTLKVEKGRSGESFYYKVSTDGGYAEYKRFFTVDNGNYSFLGEEYYAISGALYDTDIKEESNNYLILSGKYDADGQKVEESKRKEKDFTAYKEENPDATEAEFLMEIASEMAAETFYNNGSKFLWVKNIWVSDSAFRHPVEKDWDNFKGTYSYDGEASTMNAEKYQLLIKDLADETTAPNGLFILVALTALSSLGMQLLNKKSQKAQMELQTVDGQGAQTQKIMTWMMPIMMAIFAFFYTAAFSIYIIVSTLISLLTTVIINKLADMKYNKPVEGDDVIRGRVYNPPKEETPQKDKKANNKKNQPPEADFLSGLADKKKKPRGRLK